MSADGQAEEPDPHSFGSADTGRSIAAVALFGLSLGASSVVYPLMALDSGISAPVVGLLTAISAASHLTSRFVLPWLLEHVPDRALIVGASASLTLSGCALLVNIDFAAFVAAQVLQGIARALFWTSSQTHVVRSPGVPIRKLAQVQGAGHVGAFAGPALAGALLGHSSRLAVAVVVVSALAAAIGGLFLVRRPPYARLPRGQRTQFWRQPRVALGCLTSFSAGGWRGILDSFVPIVLATAGLASGVVGGLMAVSEGAVVLVSLVLARFGTDRFGPLVRVAGVAVLGGAAVLPVVAEQPVLAALALAIAGAGGGLASSLGPAIVNAHVAAHDQGAAIALAGTYRAAARLAGPSVLAGAGGVLGVPAVLVIATVGVVAPMLGLDHRVRRDDNPQVE